MVQFTLPSKAGTPLDTDERPSIVNAPSASCPTESLAPGPLQKLQAWDAARPGIPGEHWLVLAAGAAAWLLTRKSPSFLVRSAGLMAGSALVGRAASGRDGLAKLLRLTPLGRNIR